jgi:hypothetical protein
MTDISERVYQIMMRNAEKPSNQRATIDVMGGAIHKKKKHTKPHTKPHTRKPHTNKLNWVQPREYTGDVEMSVDRGDVSNKKIPKYSQPAVDITEYDMEEEAEPIDYMTEQPVDDETSGGCCCRCGGSVCGGRKNVMTYVGKNVGGQMEKPKKRPLKGNQGEGLMYYNKCLQHIKDKGYTHKEAQQILKQMKDEMGDEMNGGSWKSFWHGFKKGFTGVMKVATKVLPMVL